MVAPGDAFQHYFWGEKNAGYDVLLTNLKQGANAAKEFHEILRERANYEETFCKSLRRLSEKTFTINAVGSFLPVWNVLKKYIENMSKIHGEFSVKFKDLCQELNNFRLDTISKTNKMTKEQVEIVKTAASLNNIKTSLEHVNKCKKLYHQRHRELIEGEEALTKAGTTLDKTEKSEKELEKIQQKFAKSQEAFTQAEKSYKASVERYNKAQEEYNDDMTNSCKFFGETEQDHLSQIVEFARRFGDMEGDLIAELRKNSESVLGGLVGYTPEHLIEIFVEEKNTGVEMCPQMEVELLTVNDPPVLSTTPRPLHDKSSDSGSVSSLPNIHNATTVSAPPNMNSMTLAMTNVVSMKAIRKMIKASKPKKTKNKNEADSKSIDSKTEEQENGGADDISEKSTSEHDSGGPRSEHDFYERHATAYFSSDEEGGEDDEDSDEDGLTAKVRTIKIRNTDDSGSGKLDQPTEEDLRRATEKLTLSCLSPNTYHRDRAKTHNPQLFNTYSHSLVELTVSPDPAPKTIFPTTFNTPRAKSVSGNLDSNRDSVRSFPTTESKEGSEAWAVFDDTFRNTPKRGSESNLADQLASWSTPPVTKRTLFDNYLDKESPQEDGIEGLMEFAPSSIITVSDMDAKPDIEDLLSITMDEGRAISPASECLVCVETADSSPINPGNTRHLTPGAPTAAPNAAPTGDLVEEVDEEEDEEEIAPEGKRKRLPLIEFSPVKPLSHDAVECSEVSDPLSSTQRSEEDEVTNEEVTTPTTPPLPTSTNPLPTSNTPLATSITPLATPIIATCVDTSSNSFETDSGVASVGRDSPNLVLSADIDVEDSKLLSPLSLSSSKPSSSCGGSRDDLLNIDVTYKHDVISSNHSNNHSNNSNPDNNVDNINNDNIAITCSSNGPVSILTPSLASEVNKTMPSTEDVVFSEQLLDTAESDRDEMTYPIAIAIIETASAVFKANDECTSKVEGEVIMSLPCDAALSLSSNKLPPALKIRLTSSTPPSSFIVNRQIFSIKPPCLSDVLEVNMELLQELLRKRLECLGGQMRINIPLLKYKSPYLKYELAPLIANSHWVTCGDEVILTIDTSVNPTLIKQHFYFPRITFTNSLNGSSPLLSSTPPAEIQGDKLKWERHDIGNEIVENPDKLRAVFAADSGVSGSRTDIEFEVEGVVISGADVALEDSDSYTILTTVKKIKSDKYWVEPKVVDSSC